MDGKREYYLLMAHFAELDKNNQVLRVIVIHNNELLDDSGNEVEQKGKDFAHSLFGGDWVQTSYNGNIRGKYAGIGDTYNAAEDIFIAPQPYPSWTRNGSYWEAPTQMPLDGKYVWDEEKLQWVKIEPTDG